MECLLCTALEERKYQKITLEFLNLGIVSLVKSKKLFKMYFGFQDIWKHKNLKKMKMSPNIFFVFLLSRCFLSWLVKIPTEAEQLRAQRVRGRPHRGAVEGLGDETLDGLAQDRAVADQVSAALTG